MLVNYSPTCMWSNARGGGTWPAPPPALCVQQLYHNICTRHNSTHVCHRCTCQLLREIGGWHLSLLYERAELYAVEALGASVLHVSGVELGTILPHALPCAFECTFHNVCIGLLFRNMKDGCHDGCGHSQLCPATLPFDLSIN